MLLLQPLYQPVSQSSRIFTASSPGLPQLDCKNQNGRALRILKLDRLDAYIHINKKNLCRNTSVHIAPPLRVTSHPYISSFNRTSPFYSLFGSYIRFVLQSFIPIPNSIFDKVCMCSVILTSFVRLFFFCSRVRSLRVRCACSFVAFVYKNGKVLFVFRSCFVRVSFVFRSFFSSFMHRIKGV